MKSIPASIRLPAVAGAIVILIQAAGCGNDTRRPADEPEPYPEALATATVRLVEETRMQELPGTVRPADRATLAPKVMGVITEFPVELGQRVKRGERLARIAAGEIAARAEQARVAHVQATRDLERETELLDRGAATPESVRNLEDRVRMTQASVDEAETMLSYTRIDAPFDGVVSRIMAHEGDLASPGQPLLELERDGNLRVEADIPDGLARNLRRGDTLRVLLDGETTVEAALAEISASADARTRTVPVKLDLPAGAPARSGMFARVFVPAETIRRLEVPTGAVTPFGQIERVFVVEGGHARMRIIRTGAQHNGLVEILAGLSEGERIVAHPPPGLRNNQPVTLAGQ
ncbi:MAG: efflux RND transporter periplasmic adaptor subunit [Opitutales bacterium]|nr:efflux RND transporter periplasmic adaptor subunit [Opitutales bacterium]